MEGPFFFLVILGFVGVVLALNLAQRRKADRDWTEAARRLGFRFKPGGLIGLREMSGELQGCDVEVATVMRSSGRSRSPYTLWQVRYPQPLGLGLKLEREGFFSGVGKLLGAQDIQVGDEAFDDALLVKGRDPQEIREFLTRPRRARILRALGSYQELEIDDEGVELELSGYSDTEQLVSLSKRLAELAHTLGNAPEDDALLAGALEAQITGRVDSALEQAQQAAQAAGSYDANMLAGELLVLGGRNEEAEQAFAAAREQAPQDPDALRWSDALAAKPSPAPPAAPQVEPGGALDAASVCEALFDRKLSSFESSRLFESAYAGRTVCWKGVIERVDRFSYDFVLGDGPGTRCVVKIHEMDAGGYGTREVEAVVGLPETAQASLKGRVGAELAFEGRLLKADGLGRNVFVAQARVM